MSRGLLSPRAGTRALTDVADAPDPLVSQRVQRVRRGRARRNILTRRLVALGLCALAAASVGAAAWRLLTAPQLRVAAVEVRGASRVSVEEVLDVAGIAPGTNIFRIDPAAIAARLEALPGVRRAEVIRELPNRVAVVIEERRPFTLVHGERLYWLDEEGRLLGDASRAVVPPTPVISGLDDEEVESRRGEPGPRTRAALALIRTLVRSGSALTEAISEIDMSRRDGPVLYTVDGIEVRLGSEDWEERLGRLEGVLGQVAAQDAGVSVVDLRFRDQVVLQKGG